MTRAEQHSNLPKPAGLTPRRRRMLLVVLLGTILLGILGRAIQDIVPAQVGNALSMIVVFSASATVVMLVGFTTGRSLLTWLVVFAGACFVAGQALIVTNDIPALNGVAIFGAQGAYHDVVFRVLDFVGLSCWVLGFFGVVFEFNRARNELSKQTEALKIEMERNKASARALAASEAQYRRMVEDASDIIFQCDLSGYFTYANRMAAKATGYSVQEIVGQHFLFLISPEAQAETSQLVVQQVAERTDLMYIEFPARRRDGSTLWIGQNVSLQYADGEPCGVQAVAQDITERKMAELALRSSEERYRHLLEATGVIPWEADAETWKFNYIGPQVESILGHSQAAWHDKDFWISILHPEDRDEAIMFCRTQTELNLDHELDYRMLAADGSVRWIRDIVTIVQENGRPSLLRGIFVDITQMKEAEEERRELQQQMQHSQKLESLGVLAGGIAHDFNNFLTGIMGNADLALEHPQDAKENLQTIVTTARLAGELCQQLLAYSGRGKTVVKPQDISALVTEMGDLLEVPLSKKAQIVYALTSDLPPIEGDSAQLRQVIMNLVTNATESIEHPPGMITITTGVTTVTESQQDPATGGGVSPGRYVYVDVADNGSGMDRQTRARMFDPFYTTKFSGRGLGLAAVLGIMRGHGGGIRVESTPGSGTTMRLYFPVSDHPMPHEVGPTVTAERWRGQGTVLVVDDEAVIRDFVSTVLAEAGFDVVTADDGVQAIRRFREYAHDLAAVVLDLTMPNMNGAEAHREMRFIREGVPVVVISGFSETDVTDSFADTSLDGFLQKPFRGEELISALRVAIT